jgi:hypothetical protein
MTYHDDDPHRPVNDPYVRQPMAEPSSNTAWIVPVVLVAVLAIGGMLIYSNSDHTTTTASNEAPASRQVNPSTPTPVPAPTPAAKKQ